MRILHIAILAFAVGASAAAQAQLPFPFEPEPDFSKRAQCTRDYVRSVEKQAAAIEKLRSAGPEAVGKLCSLIEMGNAWLGGKLPDDLRKELRGLLGFDVDIERIAAQCRVSQDTLDRELMTMHGRLKAELVRCDDTI
jgi:hypothetical protein